MKFSLEIGPNTDLETVPPVNDVYITMLPGGDYKETAQKAIELVKKGFNPVPHFPARSMQDEKQLKDYGDKLSDDKKKPIEDALEGLKKAHESKDLAAIDSAMETINTAWTAASEEMYKATQEQQGAEGAAQPNAEGDGADDVTDVDFEEVKEDK